MTSNGITVPDGRRLHWYEFGDQDGSPVIYTAGTPVSGLGGASYDQTARAAGLRWISPDKPGYGGSDYQRARSLISWADDLAALAGHLGLDRIALAGESGGGPFTLAAAHRLAGRGECCRPYRVVGRAAQPGRASGPAGEDPVSRPPWPFPLSEVLLTSAPERSVGPRRRHTARA